MLEAYHEFIQSFYSWGRALRAAEMLHSDGLSFLFRLMTILKARVSCGVVEQQRSCVPLVLFREGERKNLGEARVYNSNWILARWEIPESFLIHLEGF
jgi:hypothetical protein